MDAAIEWLRERPGEVDEPWVLVVNAGNPHFPHVCPPEEENRRAEQFIEQQLEVIEGVK